MRSRSRRQKACPPGMYGQTDYSIGNIITKKEYDTYQAAKTDHPSAVPATGQASFYPAYIVTVDNLETTKGSGANAVPQRLHKGAALAKEDYTEAQWETIKGSVDVAYVVTTTVQLSKTEFMYRNSYLTASEISALKTAYPSSAIEIDKAVQAAYYCTEAGKYGGNYYETGHNYRALAAYSAMSKSDRDNFTFNYDALDLLIDKDYKNGEGVKYQYDSAAETLSGAQANSAHYSLQTSIDYTATYIGESSTTLPSNISVKRNGSTVSTNTLQKNDELTNTVFESLPNEQYHYAPIVVDKTDNTYYVVKETIVLGDTPYAAGQVITKDTYDGLSAGDKEKVASLTFTSTGTYYYCREKYRIDATTGKAVKAPKPKTIPPTIAPPTPPTPTPTLVPLYLI